MSNAPYRRPRADADEIIKAARRRSRAASSRRRALVGESAETPVVDGSLAVQPETVPVSAPPIHERETEAIPTERTRPVERPKAKPAPEPVEMPRPAFVGGVVALVVAGIVGLLLLNTVINEDAYHLQELRAEKTELSQTEQELTSELYNLNSPVYLEGRAREFGMVKPEEYTYLDLSSGETVEAPRSEE
ncbi:FtsB family cell division protein [Glycomyces tarimensis]